MTSSVPLDETRVLIEEMARRSLTVAVAESLTGGLLVAELIRIPGASQVVRGGVVAYATDLKSSLLGVDSGILSARGPVDPEVAMQMAHGARRRLGREPDAASWGVSTTGVAGPGSQDGHPAGTVFLGFATDKGTLSRRLQLEGDRDSVRKQTVAAAIRLMLETLQQN
ncbi:CinA family protein [Agreia pratensis]|uniref:Competence/damage-inducible protein cinA n=1 Tax=Agreia pratensis TaxID=150121 RepID=A0A1X7KYT0_9MICO|nr:CinA family protein [Agreia pratensis]MBF4633785.1 CinA family protein [Agreia pratensis]SMG46635.1 competence/damage-inducible protein cinA [Agreia pratensis]